MSEMGGEFSGESVAKSEIAKEQFAEYARGRADAYFDSLAKFDEIDESTDKNKQRKHFVMDKQMRPALLQTLDTLYPSSAQEEEFKQQYGIGHVSHEDVGMSKEDLQEATKWFVKERIQGWKDSIQEYLDLDIIKGNEDISREEIAWYLGTEATFFPWHPEGGYGTKMEDKVPQGNDVSAEVRESRNAFAYAPLWDLLDVPFEETGMSQEEWDAVKVKVFKMRYEYGSDSSDKRTEYLSHWGTRAARGVLLNGLEPQDIAVEDFDGFDFVDEDENEQVSFGLNRRLGRLNPDSTSPVWGRNAQDMQAA